MSRAYDEMMARLEAAEAAVKEGRPVIDYDTDGASEHEAPEADALDFPSREEWLAARRNSIGASDAPIVLGLAQRTALDLYLDKLGTVDPDEVTEPSEAMRWGTLLEPVIRLEASRRLGHDVVHIAHRIHRSRSVPYLTASLDGLMPDASRGPGVLEIKTAHRMVEDGEEAPLAYQVQVQHALLVTGCTWGVIATLYGGQRLVIYEVQRNRQAIELLMRECTAFWQRVLSKSPPPLDGTQASARLLRALFPRESAGVRVALPQEALGWDDVYVDANRQLAALEQRRDEAKHHLQNMIGDAEAGVLPDQVGSYTWKTQTRRERVTPAWTGRVFRRLSGPRDHKENGV